MPNAHYISRAKGGLGIEENIVTLCIKCHNWYDFGTREEGEKIGKFLKTYLRYKYPDWDETMLVYKKE